MIIISACLCGINCKYNGKNNYNKIFEDLVNEGRAVPICPEQLGELTTPRLPSEIQIKNNEIRIINNKNQDVTTNFLEGARKSLDIAKVLGIKKAILKGRSPSCGYGEIYDGSFSGSLIEGNGVTADLFIKNGIEVIKSEDYIEEVQNIKK